MVNLPVLHQFADSTYGCGVYNSSTYNSNSCTGTSTGSGTGGIVGTLANTGYDILIPIFIAIAIIAAAFVLLAKNLYRRRQLAKQEQASNDDANHDVTEQ